MIISPIRVRLSDESLDQTNAEKAWRRYLVILSERRLGSERAIEDMIGSLPEPIRETKRDPNYIELFGEQTRLGFDAAVRTSFRTMTKTDVVEPKNTRVERVDASTWRWGVDVVLGRFEGTLIFVPSENTDPTEVARRMAESLAKKVEKRRRWGGDRS